MNWVRENQWILVILAVPVSILIVLGMIYGLIAFGTTLDNQSRCRLLPELVSEGILHDISYKTITIGDNIVLTNANPVTITDENDKVVERAVKDTYYYLYKQGKTYHLTPWKIHSTEGGSYIER